MMVSQSPRGSLPPGPPHWSQETRAADCMCVCVCVRGGVTVCMSLNSGKKSNNALYSIHC